VVGNADDIAGEGLLGQFPVRSEEHDGGIDRQLAAGVLDLQLHAPLEAPGAKAQEGDPVPVVGIHIGLDLEDKAGDLGIARDNVGFSSRLGRGHRLGRGA